MAINGGIKFFEPSKCLFKDGATAAATTNTSAASMILTYDKNTSWNSLGSSDGNTQTLTITLPANITFNRLFLLNHNFKTFTIKYGSATDFANVVTINGATAANISESAYAYNSSYYEFNSVTTNSITISCTHVQNPATYIEKFLASLILTTETGTLSVGGLAKISPSIDANNKVTKNFNNKSIVQRGINSFQANLGFPMVYDQADLTLLDNLFYRETDYLIWICGGRTGAPYFKVSTEPYRLLDVYRVQTVSDLSNKYYKDLYCSSVVANLTCVEVEG